MGIPVGLCRTSLWAGPPCPKGISWLERGVGSGYGDSLSNCLFPVAFKLYGYNFPLVQANDQNGARGPPSGQVEVRPRSFLGLTSSFPSAQRHLFLPGTSSKETRVLSAEDDLSKGNTVPAKKAVGSEPPDDQIQPPTKLGPKST